MIEFVIAARGLNRDYALNVPFTMTISDPRINSRTQLVNIGTITSGFEFLSASFADSSVTISLQRISGSGTIRPEISLKLSSDYAVSTIQMWKNKDFLYSENNYHIDNISSYLGTADFPTNPLIPAKLQYIEFKPKITVRLDMDQSNIQFGADQNWNYCKITRYSSKEDSAYFFIKKIGWKAVNTIELELEMDVLNTFTWNSDYTVSDKTLVKREHKNRWSYGNDEGLYIPLIDFTSEGIQPALFKKFECTMYAEEDSPDGIDLGNYYLIYRSHTEDEGSPIDIFLCRDSDVVADLSSLGYTGDFVLKEYNIGISYNRWGAIYSQDTLGSSTNVGAKVTFVFYDRNNEPYSFTWQLNSNQCIRFNDKMVEWGGIDAAGFHQGGRVEYKNWVNKKLNSIYLENVVKVRTYNPGGAAYDDSWWTSANIATLDVVPGIPAGISTNLGAISDINRTDPLLLKIIKLPYPPCTYHFNEYGIMDRAPDGWKVSQNIANFPDMLEYINSGSTTCLANWFFMYPDPSHEDEFWSPYEAFAQRSFTINVDDDKNIDYESKLLHSDYFQQKFVYDSFSYTFNGEDLSEGIDDVGQFSLDFYVSLTMSSKFAFTFPAWEAALRSDTQDYSALLYVARNNEIPVYNSAYLNYIRTGYNYDIKTRNRQLASNVIGTTLSTAGAIASFAAAGATYGASIPAGIALATAATANTYKAISDTVQADQNIAQKLHAAEMQGLSVIGSDDVDIMSAYTHGNKAKFVIYKVSEKMRKNLFDLFYYTGYICNENKVPQINTRYWFNFVQCDLVCNSWNNISVEIQDVIKRKFAEGVTFFHRHLSGLASVWNLAQTKENWETDLV